MNIFIFGDSNTWGYVPTLKAYDGNDNNTRRYRDEDMWWYPLKKYNQLYVNALNGRTINNDHQELPYRNSIREFNNVIVDSKVDLTIIMLGTNDLKDCYGLRVDEIVDNLDKLVLLFTSVYHSKFMIICPPYIYDTTVTKDKYTNGVEKIQEYENKLKKYCASHNYLFASAVPCEVGVDGEHLTKAGHELLGRTIFEIIKRSI